MITFYDKNDASKKFSLLVLIGAAICTPTLALAAPDASEFKRVKANKAVSLKDCLVSGIQGAVTLKFTIASNSLSVSLPSNQKRANKTIGPKGSKFVACGASDSDPSDTVVFVKTAVSATPKEVSLSLSDFDELGNIGAACSSVKSFPGAFVYKTVGSNHFTDIRRNTIGLIMKAGANVSTPNCIDVISSNGTKVSDLGLYARGAGWFARYYGGVGCGDAINGSGLASRARNAGGSNNVYFRIGSTCYGPINSTQCIGSQQC